MSDELPETFDFPQELREKINAIRDKYRLAFAFQMMEELVDAGVELELACHIVVGEMRVGAVRVAMMACGIQKRGPRRELWIRRAEEDFDEARDWYAKLQKEGADAQIIDIRTVL